MVKNIKIEIASSNIYKTVSSEKKIVWKRNLYKRKILRWETDSYETWYCRRMMDITLTQKARSYEDLKMYRRQELRSTRQVICSYITNKAKTECEREIKA